MDDLPTHSHQAISSDSIETERSSKSAAFNPELLRANLVMANILRTAKSGSDWTENELNAYNIQVTSKRAAQFFGVPLPSVDHLDPLLLSGDVNSQGLTEPTYSVLQYLDLASHVNIGQESAIDDFAKELLKILGFQEFGTILRSRYPIPLSICGESRQAQTDVSLMHLNTTILLIVQENRASISGSDPEPQVIAEAIAAFQYNNTNRSLLGERVLNMMIIPCITMTGTRPIFYFVPVTTELSRAVRLGQFPQSVTTVTKCVLSSPSPRPNEGMDIPDFRKVALQHFVAFREFAHRFWSSYRI